jgi:hypothetical protein
MMEASFKFANVIKVKLNATEQTQRGGARN